ncbi:Hypothetical protein FKW44_002619 [Caligus rogercresseyi]|uniref:Uncharacterized protein n=1 Tax=Caligus rogercresseyi TaxID=217165 RepID=A0A7T8KKH1_CALRO|nr:Hypothetical protein FKW44_002619 [Caligus rogercresseyi]
MGGSTVGTLIKNRAQVTQWVGRPTSLGGRSWPPQAPPIPPGLPPLRDKKYSNGE